MASSITAGKFNGNSRPVGTVIHCDLALWYHAENPSAARYGEFVKKEIRGRNRVRYGLTFAYRCARIEAQNPKADGKRGL